MGAEGGILIPIPLKWLLAAASIMTAFLGALMLVGGLGLISIGFIPSASPQTATAAVLTIAGLANLGLSIWIWSGRARAVLGSGIASLVVIVYLGAVLRDFGEPFWAHTLLVALLAVVWLRLADVRASGGEWPAPERPR